MFLFLIGLEMRPAQLWALRRHIFGLGRGAGGGVRRAAVRRRRARSGLPPVVAFVAGMGFVLSSTAVIMKMLDERGETSTPPGSSIVSILLLEDLAIVPLLALVAVLAPGGAEADARAAPRGSIAIAVGAIAACLVAGRWLLNPLFRILAARGRAK